VGFGQELRGDEAAGSGEGGDGEDGAGQADQVCSDAGDEGAMV